MQYYAGIDVGSISTDVVIVDENEKIVSFSIVQTGAHSNKAAEKAFNHALLDANLTVADISLIVSTGYGRESVTFKTISMTEITCQAKGIHSIFPAVKTIIEIGGQDSKGIMIDNDGNVLDFVMNEKCAAGTGRFLEVMATALECRLEEMGELAQNATKTLLISSVCTVFAESEVVAYIASGERREDILNGICYAITRRIIAMTSHLKIVEPVALSGGVAKNSGVIAAMNELLKTNILVPDEPQITGALGAALLARQKAN